MANGKIIAPVAWLSAILIAGLAAFPLNALIVPMPLPFKEHLVPASFEAEAKELNLFHQVRKKINNDYYREDIKKKELFYHAIDGMVKQLDCNSSFFRPKAARDFEERNRGEFGGLGIYINIEAGRLIVSAPMPDSPAIKAGIRPGDIITHVDGKELPENVTTTMASERLKGPRFSKVAVRVERWRTGKIADIVVTRDIIRIPGVENVHLLAPRPGMPSTAYIRLRQFQQESEMDFLKQMTDLRKEKGNFDALIIDFRNNPGGDLDVATAIIDFFMAEEGRLMIEQAERNESKAARTTSNAPLAGVPLCILFNRNSASASELVAGALRDHGLALLAGERTHGKGSVQTLYEFRGYDEVLKLTTALYYTPNKHSPQRGEKCGHEGFCHHKADENEIRRGGLRPDLEIPLSSFETPLENLLDFTAAVSMQDMGQAYHRLAFYRFPRFIDLEVAAAAKLLGSPETYKKLMDAHD
ncbi:MAG: S41 family peptidase [Planctomycetota bacterium]